MCSPKRCLYVVKHGERVDFTFKGWLSSSFDDSGNYVRTDLNMPDSVPPRAGGPKDFWRDCPITKIGFYQAVLTGEAIKAHRIVFGDVYCSPSLRCVETCNAILKASGNESTPIKVEPALYNWLGRRKSGVPKFMSPQELKDCGLNVCLDYQPLISREKLRLGGNNETLEQYYTRARLVMETATQKITDGTVLVVGHGSTLGVCARYVLEKSCRDGYELERLIHHVPFCTVEVAEEREDGKWELVKPPFPPLTHSKVSRFDWKILLQ